MATESIPYYFAYTVRGKPIGAEVLFYPNSHRYKVRDMEDEDTKGHWVVSPSTLVSILDKSQPLMQWAVNKYHERAMELVKGGASFTADDIKNVLETSKNYYKTARDTQATIGTLVHEYAQTQKYNEEEMLQLPHEDQVRVISSCRAFDKWFEENEMEIVEREKVVYYQDKNMEYAGTLDAIVEDKKGYRYIIDYKTSKRVYAEHIIQVCMYYHAYNLWTAFNAKGCKIVTFYKDDVVDGNDNIIHRAGEFEVTDVPKDFLRKSKKLIASLYLTQQRKKELDKLLLKK